MSGLNNSSHCLRVGAAAWLASHMSMLQTVKFSKESFQDVLGNCFQWREGQFRSYLNVFVAIKLFSLWPFSFSVSDNELEA